MSVWIGLCVPLLHPPRQIVLLHLNSRAFFCSISTWFNLWIWRLHNHLKNARQQPHKHTHEYVCDNHELHRDRDVLSDLSLARWLIHPSLSLHTHTQTALCAALIFLSSCFTVAASRVFAVCKLCLRTWCVCVCLMIVSWCGGETPGWIRYLTKINTAYSYITAALYCCTRVFLSANVGLHVSFTEFKSEECGVVHACLLMIHVCVFLILGQMPFYVIKTRRKELGQHGLS